jgi:hypothetical protein
VQSVSSKVCEKFKLNQALPSTKIGFFAMKSTAFSFSILALASAAVFWGAARAANASEPMALYTVKVQDKLITLSQEVLSKPSDWPEVAKLNQLKNANRISPGQVLNIPVRLLKSTAQSAKVISTSGAVNVKAGDGLSEGAQIQVGANSSAVIELADKSRVNVLPNTLTQVVANRTYGLNDASKSISTTWFSGFMRVVTGGLEVFAAKGVDRATPLKVELPTAVVGVRGTVFRASHDGMNSKTEVLEGEVRADNPAQASGANVAKGFGAVVDPAAKEVKTAALLPPPVLPQAAIEVEEGVALNFSALAGAARYRVQVAKDSKFESIVSDAVSTAPQAQLQALPQGNYHLRARGIDAAGLEGFDAAQALSIVAKKVALPPYFGTEHGARAWLSIKDGVSMLHLDSIDASLTNARLQLARDANFAQIVTQAQVTTNSALALGKLAAGEYFVRFAGGATSAPRLSQTYRMTISPNWGQTVFIQLGTLNAER